MRTFCRNGPECSCEGREPSAGRFCGGFSRTHCRVLDLGHNALERLLKIVGGRLVVLGEGPAGGRVKTASRRQLCGRNPTAYCPERTTASEASTTRRFKCCGSKRCRDERPLACDPACPRERACRASIAAKRYCKMAYQRCARAQRAFRAAHLHLAGRGGPACTGAHSPPLARHASRGATRLSTGLRRRLSVSCAACARLGACAGRRGPLCFTPAPRAQSRAPAGVDQRPLLTPRSLRALQARIGSERCYSGP